MSGPKKNKPKLIIAKDMDDVQSKLIDNELPESNSGKPELWAFEHAIPLADRLAIPLRDILREYDDAPEDKSEADVLISRTLALFFIISLMNYPILETDNLDNALKTMKKMAKDYMEVVNSGKAN
jgi:hypothetical protein